MTRIVVFLLTGAAVAVASAADWEIGANDPNEVAVLTEDRLVDGDIIIRNRGRLEVSGGATLTVTGEVLLEDAAHLDIQDAMLHYAQNHSYQCELKVVENATVRMVDATINGNGHSFGATLLGDVRLDYERVDVVDGFCTWTFWLQAVARLVDCGNGGEFLLWHESDVELINTDTVLFWLVLPAGATADLTFPQPGPVDAWATDAVDPNDGTISGIDYRFAVENCTNLMWASLAMSGSSATYRDSTLRVVGSVFDRDNVIEITGIANGTTLQQSDFSWGDVELHLRDCHVQSWNFYAYEQTDLTLRQCLFGEVLGAGNARVFVQQSLCDGAGGYIGVGDTAQLIMFLSTNFSQTTCEGASVVYVVNSALLGAAIDVLDNATLALVNSPTAGEPRVADAANVYDLAVEPVTAPRGATVAVRGSARLLTGPESPLSFDHYALAYRPSDDPNGWTTIAGPHTAPVQDGVLGQWATCGRPIGDYTLRVTLATEPPFVLEATNNASVGLPTGLGCGVGDMNCDGFVNFSDIDPFVEALGAPADWPADCPRQHADVNDDGFINFRDIDPFVSLLTS